MGSPVRGPVDRRRPLGFLRASICDRLDREIDAIGRHNRPPRIGGSMDEAIIKSTELIRNVAPALQGTHNRLSSCGKLRSEKSRRRASSANNLFMDHVAHQWCLGQRVDLVEMAHGNWLGQKLPNAFIQRTVEQQVRSDAIGPPLTAE